jgi:nucleoside-diphosphate-sugar epimerase
MRIVLAGATGAIGRRLVPLLLQAGHEVTGLARSESRLETIRAMGADALVADALDARQVEAAVGSAAPDAVVHQLTAIPATIDPRGFAEAFEATNRLRREGTRNLVAAAIAAGATRFVAQSIAQAYEPVGGWVKTEDDPLYRDPPPVFRDIFGAVIELERVVLAASPLNPVVLRYGNFYGPGTRFAVEGSDAELVRQGRFPIAGGGPAHWSFIHVEDAAQATLHALADAEPGVYNVVDDEPAAVRDWLPVYAAALGAPAPPVAEPPRGDYGVQGMLLARGASNTKAKNGLGWAPKYASWREGFLAGLS